MSSTSPAICLITPGHVASDPRLVKEADALADAGYRVHVVAGRYHAPVDALDAGVFATARWSHTLVDYRSGPGVFARKLLGKLARSKAARSGQIPLHVAARACHAESLHLAAVASRIPAALYLGHCLAALPAAALAAEKNSARFGFDAEDFHDAETTETLASRADTSARRVLQTKLLPRCAHFSAASPLIGEHYARAYGVPRPLTLLNVFPLSHRPAAPVTPPPISAERPARCYWFSQTIGPGRGLEVAVAAFARLRTPVELHLRGAVSPAYRNQLQAGARVAGLRHAIVFHDSGPAAEMARLAANAHLGLSIEEREPLNRDLCLTNKIFVYLLAGIPQLLSATTAQSALAPELGVAALLADLGHADETARRLDDYLGHPAQLAAARRHAWTLAESRFCWDIERDTFLAAIRRVVGAPAP